MRSLAIFVGLWAGLTLSTIDAPAAEAKGIRQLQYTVKEGDTIYDLARRFGCAEKDLERANSLGAVLPVGKQLRIPACGKQAAAAKVAPKPAAKTPAPPSKVVAEKSDKSDKSDPSQKSKAKSGERANDKAVAKHEAAPAKPRDERTASRAVETPQRAHGKIAVRPRLPAPRAKVNRGEASESEARAASAASADDDAADALAAAVTAEADPVTGSIAASPPASPTAATAKAKAAPITPTAPALDDVGLPPASGQVDPVTGSIAASLATVPSAALAGAITRPSELERALPIIEDEPELPADHKLVLDGRAKGGIVAPTTEQDLLGPIGDAGQSNGQSIGLPWRGRLQSAARLGYGEGYILRRPQRTYGTRTTVAHVEHALAELRHKFPRLHTLAVGDLSAASGGRISEHRSHQSGRDIDLGLCFHERPRGYPEHFVVATEKTLNAAATWALISALADTAELDGGLSMIFLDFNVQGMIYRWALAEGIDQDRLDRIFQYPHGRGSGQGVVRHAPNHADHLHARFHCAADETGCR